ncbi:MAG: hypothetical protein ACYDA0_00970 [Candidatus Dormibacteraceae bacterium]
MGAAGTAGTAGKRRRSLVRAGAARRACACSIYAAGAIIGAIGLLAFAINLMGAMTALIAAAVAWLVVTVTIYLAVVAWRAATKKRQVAQPPASKARGVKALNALIAGKAHAGAVGDPAAMLLPIMLLPIVPVVLAAVVPTQGPANNQIPAATPANPNPRLITINPPEQCLTLKSV